MTLLDEGRWTSEPVGVTGSLEDDDGLVVECAGGSDFWRTTYYGFERDSGHALLTAYDEGRSLEVTFVADLDHQYDQAGLMVRADDHHWVKAGLELSDGVPQLGAVVTDETSDWSCGAVPEWLGARVTVRVSWTRGALLVRARAEGEPWRLVRLAPWPHASASAGLFCAAPDRAADAPGLEVRFTSVVEGVADTELHLHVEAS